jgi:hypothetical protein
MGLVMIASTNASDSRISLHIRKEKPVSRMPCKGTVHAVGKYVRLTASIYLKSTSL